MQPEVKELIVYESLRAVAAMLLQIPSQKYWFRMHDHASTTNESKNMNC